MFGNKVIYGKMVFWDKKSIGVNYYENVYIVIGI